MILSKLFTRKPDAASDLYAAIVAGARQEKFYTKLAVPDTLDGRFDMIVLHIFLVLDRLKGESESFRQRLTDVFFSDLDRTLREMGVGDLSVSKKIRPMAEAYAGRIKAYAMAIDQGGAALVEALQRNVYAGDANPNAKELANWMKDIRAKLAAIPAPKLLAGELDFPL